MQRTVTATEARIHFGEILRSVRENGATIVVERTGKPEMVMLSISEYERLRAGKPVEDDWWTRAEQAREHIARHFGNRPMPSIDDIFHEMREERDAELLAGLS